MTGNEWIGPVIIASVISAAVTAAGWLVASRREDKRHERLRAEQVLDVQVALRAEIWAHLYQLRADDLDSFPPAVEARWDTEPSYVPMISREKHDVIFEAQIGQIHILPTDAVRPVVLYYSQLKSIELFAEDMRSPHYADRGVEAKRLIYRDYIEMKKKALELGADAERALSAEIDPLRASRAGAARLNMTGADPSGQT